MQLVILAIRDNLKELTFDSKTYLGLYDHDLFSNVLIMLQALQKGFSVFEGDKITVIVSWKVGMAGIMDLDSPVVDWGLLCIVT